MKWSTVTANYQHWRGGSRWHYRHAGYSGHIVQVVDDFGNLIAVRGFLHLHDMAAARGAQ